MLCIFQAIDLAVNLMEKGETATVVADPKYCYGPEGKSPNIPPDASLTYTIELLGELAMTCHVAQMLTACFINLMLLRLLIDEYASEVGVVGTGGSWN